MAEQDGKPDVNRSDSMKPSPGATPHPDNKGPERHSVPQQPSKDPKTGDKRQP